MLLMDDRKMSKGNFIRKLTKSTNPLQTFTQTYSLKNLINLKKISDLRKSFVILPNSTKKLVFEITHICFMIYNAFSIPFYVINLFNFEKTNDIKGLFSSQKKFLDDHCRISLHWGKLP